MRDRFRSTGADLPFGDPGAYHAVAMEGYFWRLTDPRDGTVIVAFTAVNRDRDGGRWASVGLAAHPGGFVRTAVVARADADRERLGVDVGGSEGAPALRADASSLDVDLGPDAALHVRFGDRVPWPRRALGGVGLAHLVPGLGQYWHPHLLDARVSGHAQLGARRVELTGARAYGEKNWSPHPGGFPPQWWWGQAHGFAREDVCVAFAGGRLHAGPLQLTAGAIVVRLGDELVHVVAPPQGLRARVREGTWSLTGRTARDVVSLEGRAPGSPHRLPVPLPLERRVVEGASAMHLAGALRVRVRRGGRLRFDGVSALAGLEQGTPIWAGAR